jgi:hypothetical protein
LSRGLTTFEEFGKAGLAISKIASADMIEAADITVRPRNRITGPGFVEFPAISKSIPN